MGVQEQTDRKRSVKKRATKHEAPGVSTDTTCDVLREIIAFQQTQVSRDIPSVCGNLRDSKAGIECAPMLQDNELGQSQQGDPQQFLCTSQVEADSHLAVLGLRAGLPQRKSITENSGCRGHQRGHQRQPLRALTPGEGVAQPEARGHSRAFWAGPGAAGRGSDGHTLDSPVCFRVLQIMEAKWVTGASEPLSRGSPSAFGDPPCSGQSASQSLSPQGLPAGALAVQYRSPGSGRPPQTRSAWFCHWRPTAGAQGRLSPSQPAASGAEARRLPASVLSDCHSQLLPTRFCRFCSNSGSP